MKEAKPFKTEPISPNRWPTSLQTTIADRQSIKKVLLERKRSGSSILTVRLSFTSPWKLPNGKIGQARHKTVIMTKQEKEIEQEV